MKRQTGLRVAMLSVAAIALPLFRVRRRHVAENPVRDGRVARARNGRARKRRDSILPGGLHRGEHGAQRNERREPDRVAIGGLRQRRRKEESDAFC
jgi:hypothetical protein